MKRMVSIMLVMVLCFSLMPMTAFGTGAEPVGLTGTLTVTTNTSVDLENVVRNNDDSWSFLEDYPEDDSITAEFTDGPEGLVQGTDYELVWMIDGKEAEEDACGDLYIDEDVYVGHVDGTVYVPSIATEAAVTVSVKAVGMDRYDGEVAGDTSVLVAAPPEEGDDFELELTAGDGTLEVIWPEAEYGGGVDLAYYMISIMNVEDEDADEEIVTVSAITRNYTFTGLENDVEYDVTVYAVSEAQMRSNGSSISAVPLSDDMTVPGPVEIYDVEIGRGKVTVKWKAPEDDGGAKITGYGVWAVNADSDDEGVLYTSWIGADPDTYMFNYTFEGLIGGAQYEIYVEAQNARGAGEAVYVTTDAIENYVMEIGGVEVESTGEEPVYLLNDEDGKVTKTGASEDHYTIKVTFGSEVTLSLKDATIHNPAGPGIYVEDMDLYIEGEDTEAPGNNSISAVTYENEEEDIYLGGDGIVVIGSGYVEGVSFLDGNLTLDGVIGDITAESNGIFLSSGSLDVVCSMGAIAANYDAIYAMGDVTVDESGKIGSITSVEGTAISAGGDIAIYGFVGDVEAEFVGLCSSGGSVWVYDGEIGNIRTNGTGIEAYGYWDEDDETLYGGNVEFFGTVGTINAEWVGIYAEGMLYIDETGVEIITCDEGGVAVAAGNLYAYGVTITVPEGAVCSYGEVYGDGTLYASVFDGQGVYANVVTFVPGEAVAYSVIFQEDSVQDQMVFEGGKAFEPEAPKRSGYKFGGWYLDVDCTEVYDFSTEVTEDIELYAKWTKKSGGSGSSSSAGSVDEPKEPETPEVPVVSEPKNFADVHGVDHWAKEAIDFVVTRGIFSGTSETSFQPDQAMTRAMVAAILYNLEGKPEVKESSAFSDLKAGAWYVDAVNWVAEQKIVTGYTDGTYGVSDSVTREQLAVMLWKYAGRPESKKDLSGYPDADQISGYAKQAMAWANEMGIINGMKNGSLAPKGEATRAQVAQMMMNYLNK